MAYPNGQYYNPVAVQLYLSYKAVRQLHADKSLPKLEDLPQLDLYQVYPTAPPEAPEGSYAAMKPYPELNAESGHYEQVWEILPIPEPAP